MSSIIICSILPKRLNMIIQNIQNTIGRQVEIELIGIDNREKKMTNSKSLLLALFTCNYLKHSPNSQISKTLICRIDISRYRFRKKMPAIIDLTNGRIC